MKINGQCHCGNITFTFNWPGDRKSIPVRACSCSFCQIHGGVYTSHPEGVLLAHIRNENQLNRYRFGTATADFYICSQCGAVPFVVSDIDAKDYAVVNVNTFRDIDKAVFDKAITDFDGESTDNRLDRRKRNWIGSVTIETD